MTTGRLLVVEDDADVREALVDLLRHEGYDVIAAPDGERALDLLKAAANPAVALVDLAMPRMDGDELLRRMRADPELSRVPVILCTASGDVRRYQKAGIFVMRKPVRVDDLLQAIKDRIKDSPKAP